MFQKKRAIEVLKKDEQKNAGQVHLVVGASVH